MCKLYMHILTDKILAEISNDNLQNSEFVQCTMHYFASMVALATSDAAYKMFLKCYSYIHGQV